MGNLSSARANRFSLEPVSPNRALPLWADEKGARELAIRLLGAHLLRRSVTGRVVQAARIVETEAYVSGDPANHAYGGKTPRNRTMFAGPGHLYVYRIHQVHCANVTARAGEAVLLRSAEPLQGPGSFGPGPGRLCQAFGITRGDDGRPLDRGTLVLRRGPPPGERILSAPRIGIRRARDRPLRFFLEKNPWVSSPRRGLPMRPDRPSRAAAGGP
jgi:DNA-3-methyladenine glycosylase